MNQKDLRKWENKDNFIYRDDIHFIIKGIYRDWDTREDFILIDIIRKTASNTGKIKEDFIADMCYDLDNRNTYDLNITRHTFIDYNNPDGRKLNFLITTIYDQYKDLVESLGLDPDDLDKESYIEFFISEDKMSKIIYHNGETEQELSLIMV